MYTKCISRLARAGIDLTALRKILLFLDQMHFSAYDLVMFRAIFIWAYFACLRISEFAVGGLANHTLKIQDLDYAYVNGLVEAYRINFKTYKWSKGPVSRTLMKESDPSICPVLAMTKYLSIRGNMPGFLFLNDLGPVSFRTISDLVGIVNKLLAPSGSKFTSHSFRIGRCTDLYSAGTSIPVLMAKGRWSSALYKSYIRPLDVIL